MDAHTDDYVSFVLEQIAQAKLKCSDDGTHRAKLDFSKYVKDGFGTGDCMIVADGTLHIVDLKYGQGVWLKRR